MRNPPALPDSILLKFMVSPVIGYVKGKSAIHAARAYGEKNVIL